MGNLLLLLSEQNLGVLKISTLVKGQLIFTIEDLSSTSRSLDITENNSISESSFKVLSQDIDFI